MLSDEKHTENLQSQVSNKGAATGPFTGGFPQSGPVLSIIHSLSQLTPTQSGTLISQRREETQRGTSGVQSQRP